MSRAPSARYRWVVAGRVAVAFGGGYVLASLLAADLALLLPRLFALDQAEAVLTATLFGFALYAAIVLWAFATRSATRVWAGVGTACALAGLVLALLKGWG